MKLTNWRWWQWFALSLLVGAGIAVAMLQIEPANTSLPSVPFSALRYRLERRTDTGESVVTKIRVSPEYFDAAGKRTQTVTYWEKQRNKSTRQWEPTQQFITHTPVPLSTIGNKTVLDFLAAEKAKIPTLDYQFQWWLVPKNIWIACMGGSVLLIGVLWPIALKAMVKVGLAEAPDERADLSSVRTSGSAPDRAAAPKVTADDQQKLSDLTAAMEANVAGMAMAGGGGAGAARPHADAPVKDLGTSAEPVTPAIAASAEDPHDFKGEFYPVAMPIKKDK